MSETGVNREPPKAVLIAVSDSAQSQEIVTVLTRDHAVKTAVPVYDGEAAWTALKEKDFDFIILEWKLPKISGLVLFNRLRQDEKYQNVPILVVSELSQKENFILLKDYVLTGLVDGEFSLSVLSAKYDLLLHEFHWYVDKMAALDNISANLQADPEKAKAELGELIKSAPNPLPILNLAAKKFRAIEAYSEAENLLNDAFKIDDSNATAVMEMAKIYHYTGRHNEAAELMKKHKFSLKNIERLLLIGEINLAEKEPEEAKSIFLNALAIDPDQQSAKAGVLVADNMKNFLVKNDADTLPKSFASLLNLIAISLVKSNQQEEGIQQYKAALTFLHDSLSQARLMFNLGLGYLRWSKKTEALSWFAQSAKLGGEEFQKADEYIKRLAPSGVPSEESSELLSGASNDLTANGLYRK